MPDPLVVQLAEDFRRELLQRSAANLGELSRRWLQVEDALFAGMIDLAEEMQSVYEADPAQSRDRLRTRAQRMERYQALLAQVQDHLTAYGNFARAQIAGQARYYSRRGLSDAASLIQAVLDPTGEGAVGLVFNRLGTEAVENIIAIARAGQPLARLLEAAYPLAAEGLTEQLVVGTALGRNPRQVAQAMLRQSGLDRGLNHFMLVARDQEIRAYREASRQQYAASNVVLGYRRLAAKNRRTCLACLALDGSMYPTNELMPLHPQDRCAMIPIVQGFAPAQFETGAEWFQRQRPDLQEQMMGKARLRAWREGRFEFGQLASVRPNRTWGPSAQVTPLRELLAGRGGLGRRVAKPRLDREAYTPEYHSNLQELAAVEDLVSSLEGEALNADEMAEMKSLLDEARAQVRDEEEISAVARRYGYTPGKMSRSDWRQLSETLRSAALDELENVSGFQRRLTQDRLRGTKNRWMTVGKKMIQVRSGMSRRQARQVVSEFKRELRDKADQYMAQQLVAFGYPEGVIGKLGYLVKRRLLEEVAEGEVRPGKIGDVRRNLRQKVLSQVSDRDRLNASSIAKNPLAARGTEIWTYYEQAAIKAGLQPDLIPDYVMGG